MKITDKIKTNSEKKTSYKNHQFAIFIGGALLISIIFSGFSLMLYNESGAIQLDLSRPAYQEARKQAKAEKEAEEKAEKEKQKAEEFSASGDINKDVIEDFEKLYKENSVKIKGDSFKAEILSDKNLNIETE